MKNMTDITMILDRSGSMASLKADTIGGFNTFLQQQREVPGEAVVSLLQFDTTHDVSYLNCPVKDAPLLGDASFVPQGGTALLDAIGIAVTQLGARLAGLPEAERPDKVVVVIITDGEENSSREFSQAQVNDMLTTQREVYKWEFVFLGANQDAVKVAGGLGIQAGNAATYAANAMGTRISYDSVSSNLSNLRSGAVKSMAFTEADRAALNQTGK